MSSSNSWLRAQRKSDLVEVAEDVGLTNYESLKKAELELALDQYISHNSAALASDPKLAGYFQSRAKARGSPIKKEPVADDDTKPLRVMKRRSTKAPEEHESDDDAHTRTPASAVASALTRTPRNLSIARRIPLPATPADVASAVDRGTLAVRSRVTSLYQDSGLPEATHSARDSLSTVTSILLTVAAFELYFLRREVLSDRYAFTIPALAPLGTHDYPVHVPDMFLLLTSSFWSPALLWLSTSVLIPATLGYFYNLGASAAQDDASRRSTRSRPAATAYAVDPLTFSIAKALVSYVVYAQGFAFFGLVDGVSVERVEGAVYGGWRGVLAGCAITGLTSLYDAILRK